MSSNLNPNATLCTVISGSFRKHLSQISVLKKALEKLGVSVLSPEKCNPINPGEEFIILDSDPVCHPELLQASVFAKMRRSTFLVLANFDGYIGRAAAVEVGYAIALGIKIYAVDAVNDPNIAPFCAQITDVFPELQNHVLISKLKSRNKDSVLK